MPLFDHPQARDEALRLMAELHRGMHLPNPPTKGQMFGVLVGRSATGKPVTLRAFSGRFDDARNLAGWAPALVPEFRQSPAHAKIESVGQSITDLRQRIEHAKGIAAIRTQRIHAELEELKHQHLADRRQRQVQRAKSEDPALLHRLAQQSRDQKRQRKSLLHALRTEDPHLVELQTRLEGLVEQRRRLSQDLMDQLHGGTELLNHHGQRATVTDLWPSHRGLPAGVGDCCAPKLLVQASRQGIEPTGLAEFWLGPSLDHRQAGQFYEPCVHKCGPLLPFLTAGLEAAEQPTQPAALPIVHSDRECVAVAKPAGLVSAPGLVDAADALTLAREQIDPALRPVHRLDMDTSGVLVFARTPDAQRHLHRALEQRQVQKRYIAILNGTPTSHSGAIDLPLRADPSRRPLQVVDHDQGKPAVTQWRRLDDHGRVEFAPTTGRTHQLRLHAAHPEGLGIPIVGDRLYGHRAHRMMLHAASITLPRIGTITAHCPF